jgi:uncharacterized protein YbjT (DUF2867 family)
MSQISARRIAKSHAGQNHWIAERVMDRSGIPVTHLRPTFFAEWLMYLSESIRERNMFPLPFGDRSLQHISAVAQDCRDGVFSGTNDLVEKLTGQKPMQMLDYIVKNKALFVTQ